MKLHVEEKKLLKLFYLSQISTSCLGIMDACNSVDTHIDRILSKFSAYSDTYNRSLDNLAEHIATLQRELISGPGN